MPRRDERPIAVRFTTAQRAWLKQQADRLDRPVGWVIRHLVATAIRENRPLDPLPVPEDEE